MRFRGLIGKDIEFSPGIEDFNCYVESGMRATILSLTEYPEDGLFEFSLCYRKFTQHNMKFETLRFFDSKEKRYMTFRELNGYEDTEQYCVSESFDNFFVIGEINIGEMILH